MPQRSSFADTTLPVHLCGVLAEQAAAHLRAVYYFPLFTASGAPWPLAEFHIRSEGPKPLLPLATGRIQSAYGEWRTDGRQMLIESEGSVISVAGQTGNPAVKRVEWWLDPHTRTPNALAHAGCQALQAVLRYSGLHALHAAGAVEPRSGAGVVLLGESGSGKTTAALQLLRSGWRYLSDDQLALGEDGGQLRVWAVRRRFALTQRTIEACAVALRGGLGQPVSTDPAKRHFMPHAGYGPQFTPSCAPRALLFCELTGTLGSRVEAVPPREALSRLLNLAPWACFDEMASRRHMALLLRLSEQARGYRLLAGRELLSEPGRTAELLEPLMGRS